MDVRAELRRLERRQRWIDLVRRARCFVGRVLRRAANRIDPQNVIRFEGGTVFLHGMPLAHITAGDICTTRPVEGPTPSV